MMDSLSMRFAGLEDSLALPTFWGNICWTAKRARLYTRFTQSNVIYTVHAIGIFTVRAGRTFDTGRDWVLRFRGKSEYGRSHMVMKQLCAHSTF